MNHVVRKTSTHFDLSGHGRANPGTSLTNDTTSMTNSEYSTKPALTTTPPSAAAAAALDSPTTVADGLPQTLQTVSAPTTGTPRKRNKQARVPDLPVPLEKLKFLTIAQAALRYPAFSEKSLRHTVAQAEAYQRYPKAGLKSNGFVDCIIRPAGQRKILIDAEKFEEWLHSWAVAK